MLLPSESHLNWDSVCWCTQIMNLPSVESMPLNTCEHLKDEMVGTRGSDVSFHYASLICEADRRSETPLMSSRRGFCETLVAFASMVYCMFLNLHHYFEQKSSKNKFIRKGNGCIKMVQNVCFLTAWFKCFDMLTGARSSLRFENKRLLI